MKAIFGKYILTLASVICLNVQISQSQDFTHEFGKYSAEEFEMKKYDKDPSAEAVVIYDIGEAYFVRTDSWFDMIFERKVKIKIFNKAGLKYSQFEIPYYIGDERMEKIEEVIGNTYNFENGAMRKTALNSKNIYDEKYSERWNAKKFAMPDVKDGSVIEIKYKIVSPFYFNFRSWDFQWKIPVIFSEYTTKMIPFYEYTYILQGTNKLDRFESYEDKGMPSQFGSFSFQDMVYVFGMKDIPAFKDEEFITCDDDYMIKLQFQLAVYHRPNGTNEKVMSTWPKLIEDMLDEEHCGKYYKASLKYGKTINDTMKNQTRSAKEKAMILDKYVKANFNWNGREDKFATKTVKEFLKEKTGNCADINLFLAGILNGVGLEAYPVMISTRGHGKIKTDYPFHHFFNYIIVIVKIDDKYIFLDATESLLQFNELPPRCFNDKGLIVNKLKTEWASFGSIIPSLTSHVINLKLTPKNDSISGSFQIKASGYDALNLRRKYFRSAKDFKKELLKQNLTLTDSIQTNNLYQIDKPFEVNYNALINVESIEDKILVAPFCETVISENPMKQVFRTYPIDMVYKNAHRFISTITIPEGYKIVNKPASLNINNDQVEIQYMVEELGNNTIKIYGFYDFKKDVYQANEYTYIKGYFNRIVDKFNEKIILFKK
jgi:hypothetical protein